MSQPFGHLYQPSHLRHAGDVHHFGHAHRPRINPGHHSPHRNGPPRSPHRSGPPRSPHQHQNGNVQVYSYPRPQQQQQPPPQQQQRYSNPRPQQPPPQQQQQRYNNHNGYHTQQNGYHNGYHSNYNNGYSPRGRGRGRGRGGGRGGPINSGGPRGGGRGRGGTDRDDLEWDNYDLGLSGPSKGRGRNNSRNAFSQHRGGSSGVELSELEWDDYDLRPKDDDSSAEESQESLDMLLADGFLPLLQLGVMTKSSLSKGNLPVGAIQVRRVPNKHDHNTKAFDLNKELLVLTSELNGTNLINGDQSDSKEVVKDILRRQNSKNASKKGNKHIDRTNLKTAAYQLSDLCEDDFLDDAYELTYPDRLADVDVYALLPQDFDSPDSIFSRSLADLTDLSLYEELGLEEAGSIGDVSLEKIGEDLSDEVFNKANPSQSQSKFNNRRRRGKDGSLKSKAKKAKKRKRKGSEKVEDGVGGDDDEKKPKRLAPNFFVAIQVSSQEIQDALHGVQMTVVTGDEKLKDAMVPIATLHLTIMVMHLANDDDIARAKAALRECNEVLSPRFEKDGNINIAFQGLGHFNNQVMFAKIKDEDEIVNNLYEIAEIVETSFKNHNIVSTGERGFKPHLTVMKLSRAPSLRKKGVRRIKSELYKVHSNELFGVQAMDGLQLCSINKPKDPEGYYFKAEEIRFGHFSGMESISEDVAMHTDESSTPTDDKDESSTPVDESTEIDNKPTIDTNGEETDLICKDHSSPENNNHINSDLCLETKDAKIEDGNTQGVDTSNSTKNTCTNNVDNNVSPLQNGLDTSIPEGNQ